MYCLSFNQIYRNEFEISLIVRDYLESIPVGLRIRKNILKSFIGSYVQVRHKPYIRRCFIFRTAWNIQIIKKTIKNMVLKLILLSVSNGKLVRKTK